MNRVANIFVLVLGRIEDRAARFRERQTVPNLLADYLYLWETTVVRQTIDTARIYVLTETPIPAFPATHGHVFLGEGHGTSRCGHWTICSKLQRLAAG